MARRSWAMGLERIDSRGVVSSIPFADRAVPTRPGDVLVTEATARRARLYRPDDQTSYRLPELPRGDLESVAIDQLGGVWVVRGGDRQETLYSPDGRAPWRAARLRLPVGAFAGRLSVAGNRVLLRARDTGSTGPRLAALLAQDTGAPGRWRPVDLADVDSRGWDEPVVAGLPGGRVLLGDWGRRWYAGTSGDWRRLELPDDQEFALEVHGDLVFATSGLGELFVSDDDAATWTKFDR